MLFTIRLNPTAFVNNQTIHVDALHDHRGMVALTGMRVPFLLQVSKTATLRAPRNAFPLTKLSSLQQARFLSIFPVCVSGVGKGNVMSHDHRLFLVVLRMPFVALYCPRLLTLGALSWNVLFCCLFRTPTRTASPRLLLHRFSTSSLQHASFLSLRTLKETVVSAPRRWFHIGLME